MSSRRLSAPVLACALLACQGKPQPDAFARSSSADDARGRVVLPADSPMLAEIHVDTVTSAEVPTVEVVAPGKLRADPNRLAKVELPVTGRITQVFVSLGDAVTEGKPLMEVDSPEAADVQSAYLQARASVAESAAALSKAEADRERVRDLFEHKAVARKEVLNADTEYEQRRQALAQA
ncbi:MAG: efflux RND transporter periplasmic adaptor subunit, partial [Polyangiales bacterium]